METTVTQKPKYSVTYWINKSKTISLVRVSDIIVQGWKADGRELDKNYEHSHFQTVYPSKQRLDDYLKDFDLSTVDDYMEIQFAQHQLDDYFREKAVEFKNKRAAS